jgi:hypothetical protein
MNLQTGATTMILPSRNLADSEIGNSSPIFDALAGRRGD